jgi:hypothetical protein
MAHVLAPLERQLLLRRLVARVGVTGEPPNIELHPGTRDSR